MADKQYAPAASSFPAFGTVTHKMIPAPNQDPNGPIRLVPAMHFTPSPMGMPLANCLPGLNNPSNPPNVLPGSALPKDNNGAFNPGNRMPLAPGFPGLNSGIRRGLSGLPPSNLNLNPPARVYPDSGICLSDKTWREYLERHKVVTASVILNALIVAWRDNRACQHKFIDIITNQYCYMCGLTPPLEYYKTRGKLYECTAEPVPCFAQILDYSRQMVRLSGLEDSKAEALIKDIEALIKELSDMAAH